MPFDIPEFEMPFRARTHPHLERIRERSRTWPRDMGMLRAGVWDPGYPDFADLGRFVALTHPEASPDHLDLVADWHNWGWFVDDYFVETFKRTRNMVGAKAFVERLKAFLPVDGSAPPPPLSPVEHGLTDLWPRTLPMLPDELRHRFPAVLADFLDGFLWELHNDVQERVPDPVDFVEMRRKTVGAEFSATLAQFGAGAGLPPEIRDSPQMRTLAETYSDVMGLHNDIVSFEKDVVGESDVNNAVLAVQQFFGGTLPEAVNVVNDLISARLRQFQSTVADELPVLAAEHNLGPDARQALARYVATLQYWMSGYFEWSRHSGRYRASRPVQRRLTFRSPNGLGTVAVSVGR